MKNYLKEQKKQQHTNLKQVINGSNLQLYRKKKQVWQDIERMFHLGKVVYLAYHEEIYY
jgi:hypothetical protein